MRDPAVRRGNPRPAPLRGVVPALGSRYLPGERHRPAYHPPGVQAPPSVVLTRAGPTRVRVAGRVASGAGPLPRFDRSAPGFDARVGTQRARDSGAWTARSDRRARSVQRSRGGAVKFGPWIERLECIAAGRELIATGGWRDIAGAPQTAGRAHVVPNTLLDDKGAGWTLDTQAAVRAIAFAGDELVLTGADDGQLGAWDVTGRKLLASITLG